MPLTDTACRTAKPQDKPYKLADGGGMFLLVNPSGSKWWRLKYRYDGKEKLLSLGTYPEVGLRDARDQREDMRRLLAAGVDPSANRKAQVEARAAATANSFEVIAREWYGKHAQTWVPSYASKVKAQLENDLFPWLASRPIAEITPPELLAVLRRIEGRGALETAHRVRQICSLMFRYAIATGRVQRDIAADLKGALPPAKGGHMAAVTDPRQVGGLLRTFDAYSGSLVVQCALRLAPLVFVRPGELRTAEWAHIDFEAAEWRYQASKTETDHIVPLSTQALAILGEVHALTGGGRYVFPGQRTRTRPMSDNAILSAMRRMGIAKDEMTGHGFRAMARTILDEVLHVRPDYIEHQLAHAVKDANGRAYNRTAHLVERRKMMQQWADYLDTLKEGGNVIPVQFGQKG